MKAIQTGNTFRIYEDDLKTYNQLPAAYYLLNFSKMTGFFLTEYKDIEIYEKVYGPHNEKVNKVINSFNKFNRNLGVILSGDRGIGKSLFSKLLSIKAVNSGYPLIIVNNYYPGIADFINSIDQEVMILFDEFDKTFGKTKDEDSKNPQIELLTLFDGLAYGKKLFVITCNEIMSLNRFLINRPGRFHYHIRFDYPEAREIEKYLMDKLDNAAEKYDEITKIVNFSNKVKINYDCLRAIAFEINSGLTFEEAIVDLNIVNLEENFYDIAAYLNNGIVLIKSYYRLNLFNYNKNILIEFVDPETKTDVCYISFSPKDIKYDLRTGNSIVKGENTEIEIEEKYLKEEDAVLFEKYKDAKVEYLTIKIRKNDRIHYNIADSSAIN